MTEIRLDYEALADASRQTALQRIEDRRVEDSAAEEEPHAEDAARVAKLRAVLDAVHRGRAANRRATLSEEDGSSLRSSARVNREWIGAEDGGLEDDDGRPLDGDEDDDGREDGSGRSLSDTPAYVAQREAQRAAARARGRVDAAAAADPEHEAHRSHRRLEKRLERGVGGEGGGDRAEVLAEITRKQAETNRKRRARAATAGAGAAAAGPDGAGAGDVSYINARNMRFNRAIEKQFGQHTAELRANLERGTALR